MLPEVTLENEVSGAHSGISQVTVSVMESSLEGLQLIQRWYPSTTGAVGFTSTVVNI